MINSQTMMEYDTISETQILVKDDITSILIFKSQNCQFKLKFGTQTNSNMQNSNGYVHFFGF